MEKASSILFSTICLEFQTMKAMNFQEIVCKPSKRDEEKQKPNAANLVNFFFLASSARFLLAFDEVLYLACIQSWGKEELSTQINSVRLVSCLDLTSKSCHTSS